MLLPLLALAQAAAPLPKGTAIPLASPEERAIMAPIDGLFRALTSRDAAAFAPFLMPQGLTTAAVERPDGTRTIRQQSFADWTAGIKPGPEHYEERLSNPAIEIDGDIAMVWGRYVFLFDGKLHHCGVDHFSLARSGGGWKIAAITWSQRTTGCE